MTLQFHTLRSVLWCFGFSLRCEYNLSTHYYLVFVPAFTTIQRAYVLSSHLSMLIAALQARCTKNLAIPDATEPDLQAYHARHASYRIRTQDGKLTALFLQLLSGLSVCLTVQDCCLV